MSRGFVAANQVEVGNVVAAGEENEGGKEAASIVYCPKRHPLSPFYSDRAGFVCDGCGKEMPTKSRYVGLNYL